MKTLVEHVTVARADAAAAATPISPARHALLLQRAALVAATAAGSSLLGGCLTLMPPRVEMPETAPVMPVVQTPPPQTNGSLFQPQTYRPLFEDYRARLVGDTLVVNIVEKITATQSSKSTVDKSGSLSGSVTALPGVTPNALRRASVGGTSANTFAGKGETENTNDFTGTITVTVTGVLPNGHLVVTGEKQIGVNSNVDVLRFTGQVDPRAIQPGNSVASTQVANVRVEHRGRGQQADANAIGWLSRFFLTILPI